MHVRSERVHCCHPVLAAFNVNQVLKIIWDVGSVIQRRPQSSLALIKRPRSSRDQNISPGRLLSMITKWLIKTILSFNFELSECLFIYLKITTQFSFAEIVCSRTSEVKPSCPQKRAAQIKSEMALRRQALGKTLLWSKIK